MKPLLETLLAAIRRPRRHAPEELALPTDAEVARWGSMKEAAFWNAHCWRNSDRYHEARARARRARCYRALDE